MLYIVTPRGGSAERMRGFRLLGGDSYLWLVGNGRMVVVVVVVVIIVPIPPFPTNQR